MTQGQTFLRYQPLLQQIAMRMLRSKADAEDVVQETFIKWLSQEQKNIHNTKAYLVKAVTNNCINHLQSLRKKRVEYLESFQWGEVMEKFKESTDFAHLDLEAELAKALHVLLTRLQPLERAVYVLKEVFDFDYHALQEVLDKKQDHCRQLFCRAKKKLEDGSNNLNAAFQPRKAALLESFRRACEIGQPLDLVHQLRTN